MSLSPIPEREQKSDFKKMQFASLEQGPNLVRVIDDDYVAVETHFINKMSIRCLGDDCPVCANNRLLIKDNPDTFRDVKGYYPRSTRYFIHVFDRSPVKICPKCGAEVKKVSSPFCPCGESIVSVAITPLNKIKVLAKGKTLFEQLIQLEQAITDDEGTRIGLKNFDIQLMVAGTGKTTTTTPIFNGKRGAPPEYSEDDKFDLSNAVITLTPSEIRDFQMGVSLKDIYTGRKLSGESVPTKASPKVDMPSNLEEAAEAALNLFK